MLPATPDSLVPRRAGFTSKLFWAIMDGAKDGSRVHPGGKGVPHTRDEPTENIGPWARESASVDGEAMLR